MEPVYLITDQPQEKPTLAEGKKWTAILRDALLRGYAPLPSHLLFDKNVNVFKPRRVDDMVFTTFAAANLAKRCETALAYLDFGVSGDFKERLCEIKADGVEIVSYIAEECPENPAPFRTAIAQAPSARDTAPIPEDKTPVAFVLSGLTDIRQSRDACENMFRYAELAMEDVKNGDIVPLHLQYTYIKNNAIKCDNDKEQQIYKDACKAWILKSDLVMAYVDNGITELDDELIDFAKANGKKVLLRRHPTYEPHYNEASPNTQRLINRLMAPKTP